MPVPVMQIGHVRMRMPQRFVHVLVSMGLGSLVSVVRVPVMLVVNVAMGVCQAPVLVRVAMRLRQHQPGCYRHQRGGGEQAWRERFAKQRHGDCRADERRCAEMRPSSRGSEVPQRVDEQHQAHAVSDETQRNRADDCCYRGK